MVKGKWYGSAMRSNRKKPDSTDRAGRVVSGGRGGPGAADSDSRQVDQFRKKVGNTELAARVGASSEKRDELLAFISQRMKKMSVVQQEEIYLLWSPETIMKSSILV